jgi:hypothetical protein
VPARYACDSRQADSHPRREKDDVDEVIDRRLLSLLRDHRSWATAAELEPTTEAIAGYAEYLAARMAVYDAHIGAARDNPALRRQRADLHDTLQLVTTIQQRGALAAARLTYFYPHSWHDREESPFTELARALLTTRVEVSELVVTVSTPIDEGTELRRVLRVRELRTELNELETRHREVVEELASLEE